LLASNRNAAILGTLLTIVLAIIFTGLQAFEYAQSSITIADSVFGSAFFCATGLHGYLLPLSITLYSPKNNKILLNKYKKNTIFPKKKNISTLNKNFPNKKVNQPLSNKNMIKFFILNSFSKMKIKLSTILIKFKDFILNYLLIIYYNINLLNINIVIFLGFFIYKFYFQLYNIYGIIAFLISFIISVSITSFILNKFKYSDNFFIRCFQKFIIFFLFFYIYY
jgi:hypothetical protein